MDVWLTAPSELAPRWDWLSADERARAERFIVPHAREEFVAARTLIRGELARREGCEPQALDFRFGEHGRPVLNPPRAFDFNLSHTRGMVACAIGTSVFGIDVENATRPTDFSGVARIVFTEGERASLAAHPDPRRYFFEMWTLKEAYIKARGMGFSLPPRQFEVSFTATPRLRFIGFADPQTWYTTVWWPTAEHVCAIVSDTRTVGTLHHQGHATEILIQ